MKNKIIILFVLLSGCSSKILPPTEYLAVDLVMPIYGTNEQPPSSGIKYIDTVSVFSFSLNEAPAFKNLSDSMMLKALRIEAAKLGANSITDVKLRKERILYRGKFGSVERVKSVMTGKAVLNASAPKCVNSKMLNALFHKHKKYVKPDGIHLSMTDLEGGTFWLNSNNELSVSLKTYESVRKDPIPQITALTTVQEYDRIQKAKKDLNNMKTVTHKFALSISQQEIMHFSENIRLGYRLSPAGVKVDY
jgi:hypothetical protein